jgi:ABC-type transport system substrate-binding protein
MNRKLAIGILVTAVTFLSGFFWSQKFDGVIRTNLLGFKIDDSLDPVNLRFVQEYFVLDNMAVKLVGIGKDHEYINDLARTISFAADRRTMDVVLKKAYFSDGSLITAADVAASLKRTALLGSPHANIKNLWVGSEKLKAVDDNIEGIHVVADDHLVLTLTKPTKEILYFLTLTDMAILHKSQYRKPSLLIKDWMAVTSGAYHAEFSKNNQLLLVANSHTLNFSPSMPMQVSFEGYKGDDVISKLKDASLDFGTINLKDYINNIETIEAINDFDVIGSKTDGVVYIGLNVKSKIFSKKENRQWIQKKIITSYFVNKKYEKVSEKAYQFFLPEAKGYIPKSEIESMLPNVDLSKVPRDLKGGIKISGIEGMKYYTPPDIANELSSALGIRVVVDLSVPSKDFSAFMEKRSFDATILGFGMSYKVLGESLNLQYLSKNPFLLDPTGHVKSLLTRYQNEENNEKERALITSILAQMVADAECVPLFYFSTPFFVKKGRLEASNLNLDESVKFYKAAVK